MCHLCDRSIDRRSLLKAGAAGLVAAAVLAPAGRADALGRAPFEIRGTGEEPLPVRRGAPLPGRSALDLSLLTEAPLLDEPAVLLASTTLAAPPVVSRAQWGADESICTTDRAFAPIRKIVVHHSASPSNPSNPAAVVRDILAFHVTTRGFADVGYNFLIDHRGTIYQGRKGGNVYGEDASGYGVVGAHALGVNVGSIGICLVGDFTSRPPTDACLASLTRLVAWEAARHRIDPLGSDLYVSLFGDRRTFPNIAGHRDTLATECPGAAMWSQLPSLRRGVTSLTGRFPAQTVDMAAAIRYTNGAKPISPDPSQGSPSADPTLLGYRIAGADGRVVRVGGGTPVGTPQSVGMTSLAAVAGARPGYVALGTDGRVQGFGIGLTGRIQPGAWKPADVAATAGGDAAWVLRTDGGVIPFGAAGWFGSPRAQQVKVAAQRIQSTPSGRGYWVLGADGRLRAFGDAGVLPAPSGSVTGALVDFWPTPTGRGAWLLGADGRVYAVGDAPERGDLADKGTGWTRPAVAIVGTPNGKGYALLDAAGRVHAFGSAKPVDAAATVGTPVGLAGVTGV